jgi:hypothetical protein
MASSDIGALHTLAYEQGRDVIDHAVEYVAMFLDVMTMIRSSRAENPAYFPGYGSDVSLDHFARRIVGLMLDAGWTPPTIDPKGDVQMTSPTLDPQS